MKDDTISRKAIMKEFADFVRESNNSDFARTPTWNDAVSLVESMPFVQPERKEGEWIIHEVLGFNCHPTNRYFAECSECGTLTEEWRGDLFPPRLRFCTNCGAYNERRIDGQ